MAESYSPSEPWVLFRLNHQIYGIPASNTQEMITIPDITPIPRAPEHVRGLINLRGSVIAMIDLRLKLGQPTTDQETEEFILLMQQREREHVEWLAALQHTIDTGEPFAKERDPHRCAFGRWYDNFHTENPQLGGLFQRFNSPHRGIHAAAGLVEEQLRLGNKHRAQEIMNNVRETHEEQLHQLFREMEEAFRTIRQEVAIVVEHSNTVLALTVDAVESVETLQPNSIEDLPGDTGAEKNYIVSMLGRRQSDNSPVLIPDLSRIVNEAAAIAEAQQTQQNADQAA